MNLKTLSTTALISRLHTLEAAGRYARDLEALRLYAEWRHVRDELDSRPTDAVLEALRH